MTNRELFSLVNRRVIHADPRAMAEAIRELVDRELQRMNPTHGADPCKFPNRELEDTTLCKYGTPGCGACHG